MIQYLRRKRGGLADVEVLGGNRGQTSSPHPLALRLAKTSGVRSVYLSAALVKTYQRCDGCLGGIRGKEIDADRFSTHDFHLPNLDRKPELEISCNLTHWTLDRPGIWSGLGG